MTTTRNLIKELINAAREEITNKDEKEKRLEKIKYLIEIEKVPVDSKDGYSRTVLLHAAWHNQLEVVEYLHLKGADISIKDYREATPLISAADYGHVAIVAYLLEQKGIDIDAVNQHKKSALICAASTKQDNHLNCVKLLLAKNANVNLQDEDKNTALMLAQHPRVFDAILDAKPNVELKNNKGKTILLEICSLDGTESVRRLKRLFEKYPHIDVNVQDNEGNSALNLILKNQQEDNDALIKLKLLLAASINQELINKQFFPIPSKKINLLLEAGYKPVLKSTLEKLTYGYTTNSFDTVYSSLEEGEFKSTDDKEGLTKLYLKAIEDKNFDIAIKLIKFINPNAKINNGLSLLEQAFNLKQMQLAKALMDAGADKEQVDTAGKSLLMRLIPNLSSTKCALFLIEKGANLSDVSKNGETALSLAVERFEPELVKAILDRHTANINLKNKQNRTPLFVAGAEFVDSQPKGSKEVIKLLLDAGADRTFVVEVGFFHKKFTFNSLAESFRPLKKFVREYDEQASKPKCSVASIAKGLQISLTSASAEPVTELKSTPLEGGKKTIESSTEEASPRSAFTFGLRA